MLPGALMIANRGEIALRIIRTAVELGIRIVAVCSEDDRHGLHTTRADDVVVLAGVGPRAYLDVAAVVRAARSKRCDAIHPGYGFLAERAELARACVEVGVIFVGPPPEVLEVLGDKARARAVAERAGVPVLPGTAGPTSLDEARAFLAKLGAGGALVVKAVAGGGGRGLRAVTTPDALGDAFARCRSEAEAAFGCGDLYVEQLVPRARHVEVQVAGDVTGGLVALGERECTLQRRHQKIVEVAPSPSLTPALRAQLADAALSLAKAVQLRNLGTFEFLLDADARDPTPVFIEANPRLQVEHTVTEEVFGLDLVALQLRLAGGATLAELGLDAPPSPRGVAVQARVNAETIGADGVLRPSAGAVTVFEPPAGPGIRVDAGVAAHSMVSPAFDPLVAKVIAHAGSWEAALVRLRRALAELEIDGVATNAGMLRALLAHPDVVANRVHTRFVEEHATELASRVQESGRDTVTAHATATTTSRSGAGGRGVRPAADVDRIDPLAVLKHGRTSSGGDARSADPGAIPAPLHGTVVSVDVAPGAVVAPGAQLLVLEAMKMEHVVAAPAGGRVLHVAVAPGDTVLEGATLIVLEPADTHQQGATAAEAADLDHIRPDLAEARTRHAFGHDAARPDAVARRRKTGQRTARENVDDLCDPGTFAEYGALQVAAQRRRRSLDDLVRRTPGDGMVAGVGRVGGRRCIVMSYDYTVLAGTQGLQNHRKKDRLFEIAARDRLPVVLLAEGGGGRPGDTDGSGVAGLDCRAFEYFARLSGLVPLVGIVSGYCFAGNAALLGCCDVVIATAGTSLGMGGPAMIEGGGLGVYHPADVGPLEVQVRNGVVDVAVEDEAEAVLVAKRYLGYFQGASKDHEHADQRLLRTLVPENRLRVYDVRAVIETLADVGSTLELRRGFGAGMVTALARVDGRPLGVVANNPMHLAGAIDADGADKAARFMQLCDAHDLPILFLCDTPGIMVGPDVERRALVRHAARMFVVGASLSVPFFTIVLRKGYGLGAQAMAGGSFHAGRFTVAWPSGEFGGMGLEGAVKLGFRKELAAIDDPAERRRRFDEMVAHMYEVGKAVNVASHFEIDDVIDPADSRRWILSALDAAPPRPRRRKRRPCIDPW
jgi:acetyl/propionyl-CoA carboxylase alpha subunit/acetyl-CoA carboxylase carboxyltransferase component